MALGSQAFVVIESKEELISGTLTTRNLFAVVFQSSFELTKDNFFKLRKRKVHLFISSQASSADTTSSSSGRTPLTRSSRMISRAGDLSQYEIGVAIYEDKIVWVNGPFPGARHDMTIFREDGLKERMPQGKIAVLDRGYQTSKPDEVNMLATPQMNDDPEVHKFMSRVRCRTETVMGRLKSFKILSEMFHHGPEKHEMAFKAVAVIVQCHIDHGAFLFEV